MAIGLRVTVGSVPRTKQIDPKLRKHFGLELKRWMDEKHGGNQSEVGRALGISQSHVSAMLSGDRGVGLPVLLLVQTALREDGIHRTLDQLLGIQQESGEAEDTIRRMLREELMAIRGKSSPPAAPSSPQVARAASRARADR